VAGTDEAGGLISRRVATAVGAGQPGKVALRSAAKGVDLLTPEDFLAGMTHRAHAAQRRIRELAAARSKRSAG
jgi:hypothetical protein